MAKSLQKRVCKLMDSRFNVERVRTSRYCVRYESESGEKTRLFLVGKVAEASDVGLCRCHGPLSNNTLVSSRKCVHTNALLYCSIWSVTPPLMC